MKWPGLAAKLRCSVVEALVTITVALLKPANRKPDPELLRRALYLYGLNPRRWDDDPPKPEAEALAWQDKHALPVIEISEPEIVRKVLGACSLRIRSIGCSGRPPRWPRRLTGG